MTAAEAVAFFDGYRRRFDPPVLTHVTVRSVRRTRRRLRRSSPTPVTGSATRSWPRPERRASPASPRSPPTGPDGSNRSTALEYRRPSQLDRARQVLVVGASASGVQIADELRRSGHDGDDRGRRARPPAAQVPRTRHLLVDGRDRSARRALRRGRRHRSRPAPRVGAGRRQRRRPRSRSERLQRARRARRRARDGRRRRPGAVLRWAREPRGQRRPEAGPPARRIDEFVSASRPRRRGRSGDDRRRRPGSTMSRPSSISARFSTVVWATGYRPTYRLARPGRVRSAAQGRARRRCRVVSPACTCSACPFMRRRRSNLIGGMRLDAADLAGHLRGYLDDVARTRTVRPGMAGSGRPGQQRLARAMDDVLDGTRAAD